MNRTWRRFNRRSIPPSAWWRASTRLLAAERRRKRQDLLEATEKEFAKIAAEVNRRKHKLLSETAIALKVGKVRNRFKVGKHFELTIADGVFGWERNEDVDPPRDANWTAFMWCAPANRASNARPRTPCGATKACRKWSAPSAP